MEDQTTLTLDAPSVEVSETVKSRLREIHRAAEAERIDRGVDQVLRFWRQEDGDEDALRSFVEEEFVPAGETLDLTFERFEFVLERTGGYLNSLQRDLRRGADLDLGPMLPLDRRLSAYSPAAHLLDDFFANKIAFVALLNFPLSTLAEQLAHGDGWTRRQWAEARLAENFSTRLPAEVSQKISAARSTADSYINDYNIHLHHLLTEDGRRLFPEGLRHISHWGLRDELKARYQEPDGLEKQRLIKTVFDRIVRQEIPAVVVDSPRFDWTPATNAVVPSAVGDGTAAAESPAALAAREPDERYRHWLGLFHALRGADPYYPDDPTFIDRRFNRSRQIPETEVEGLLETILSSPLGRRTGKLVERRLGRALEPLDIWYVGFKPRGSYTEEDLDARTRERFPTTEAFAAELPRILEDLGFAPERARFVAERTVIEPSRGAGHAMGATRRDDNAHLRTRVGSKGLDFQGYNVAMHELGHTVEQVFSVSTIDHTLLQGVPNVACTEAMAFMFQHRDLELLGLESPDPDAGHLHVLDTFWNTREIAGVSLLDMRVWRWLYDHPDAEPAAFRRAVLEISREVWNRYFADVFGHRDETLLAVYSHLVDAAMYTPDYTIGHVIAFQIEQYFKRYEGCLGDEFERICQLGALTPDLWMRQAVGSPISAEPMLQATVAALDAVG
jgi:hypothetical protein